MKGACSLKYWNLMYQLVPMLEIDLTKSLPALAHTHQSLAHLKDQKPHHSDLNEDHEEVEQSNPMEDQNYQQVLGEGFAGFRGWG